VWCGLFKGDACEKEMFKVPEKQRREKFFKKCQHARRSRSLLQGLQQQAHAGIFSDEKRQGGHEESSRQEKEARPFEEKQVSAQEA